MATKKPKDRDASKELSSIIPMLGDLAKANNAAYISGQKELTDYQWQKYQEQYPMLSSLVRGETNKDRQDAIDFLSRGGDVWDAYGQGSPDTVASLRRLTDMADATGATPDITRELDQQALNELKLGRALTPEQERAATESARTAFAARGQAAGTPAALAEFLGRDSMGQAMLDARRNFATSRETGNRAFDLSQAALASETDPVMRILGMSSPATSNSAASMGFLQGVRTPDPSATTNAGLSYGSDVYGSNFNAAWSNYLGQQNMLYGQQQAGAMNSAARSAGNSQLLGAGIGAAGAIAGGAAAGFAGSATGSALLAAGGTALVAF